MAALAEAQERSEREIAALAEAQRRTEEGMAALQAAQQRTEQLLQRFLNSQLHGNGRKGNSGKK